MADELGRFKMSNRFQMTFHMGSGAPGSEVAERLVKQVKRLRSDPTKTLRIALRVLEKTPANDPVLNEALHLEQ